MKITHHATGSKGNTTTIDNIVIDVHIKGLPCDILLLTHTHSDHMGRKPYNNLKEYLQRCKAFVTSYEVYEDVLDKVDFKELVKEKYALDGFAQEYHGDYRIKPLPMYHDVPCCGFLIEKDERYLHITDTVKVDITKEIKNCDYISIESNYDETLFQSNVYNGKYGAWGDFHIKRVKDTGHLSNDDTCEILGEIMGERTKKVWLIHISGDNNHELLIRNKFRDERIEIA